ncbi:uncharacterized protein LOC107862324 isoform X2 [Capsicum annuum]|uniref:uncharacterized protein LOC107862324 isoform X2 n=1 Tax=Capsicum annuum TaxID=4072 RepID=UPI0007BF23A3|nr:uncharacterized protein LOC107862324 isoform X2 [Capsicum annuum]
MSVCRRGTEMATHIPRQKEPHTLQQAHKEKICGICGDIGFEEAIVTCYKCKNVDMHQYCILGYREDAQEDWCCEECDKGKGVMSSSRGLENEYSGSKLHASAKVFQNCVPPKKRDRFPGGHSINWEKEVQTGKTRYLPVEEALGLSSGTKWMKTTSSSRVVPTKSMETMTRGNFSKPSFPEKCPVQRSSGLAGYTKPQNLQKAKITEQSKKAAQISKCPGGSSILERRSPNAVNESRMIPTTHPCDPAKYPSWKGSFDILGALDFAPGMFNNFIHAHPPSRVRRKVYEFSRVLPDTLKFELVPRGDNWASLFNDNCPGKEDIGLYFFASERERSEIYIALVEFMRIKDLVMRALINDVELLVLASTALCSDSQRLNSKHFLWGLFHRVGQDTVRCAQGGSNEVTDMVINMIGGEDVCTASEIDMECYQNEVGMVGNQDEVEMEVDMIAGEKVGTLDIVVNEVDMGGYQNEVVMEGNQDEVEMEVDMMAGENVGKLDIVVSSTTRNGFDSSLKETVTAATSNGSESVGPFISRASESWKELPRVVKSEAADDFFPPGFVPRQLLLNYHAT